jgi:histidine triad (HIT) family protein
MDCIFCNIVAGKIPGTVVDYQDHDIFAFRDIKPVASTHILIIPKKHIASLNELKPSDLQLISKMVDTANRLAKQNGVSEKGYRLVINTGKEGGQLVQHLHMHLIGGRQLVDALG